MTAYHPPQRAVRAAVFTGSRWIEGTFHLPRLHAFDEHVCRSRTFFSLTDVDVAPGRRLPFLALRAAAAHVIVPRCREDDLLLGEARGLEPREVQVHLERLALRGEVGVLPGVRTSDFLARVEGFITLRRVRLRPPLAGAREPLPVAVLGAAAVIAVVEQGSDARVEVPAAEAVPV